MILFILAWNNKCDGGALSLSSLYEHVALVVLGYDVVGYLHSESCSLADRLCRDGLVEEFLLNVLRHSGAVVADGYRQLAVSDGCVDGDCRCEVSVAVCLFLVCALLYGLARIVHDVDDGA